MGLNVAITGMGVVSALGHTAEELFRRLENNDIAVKQVPWTMDDPDRFEWWAPVTDVNAEKYLDDHVFAGTDPFAHNSLVAAFHAVENSGQTDFDPLRTAVVLGTSKNGTQTMEYAQFMADRGGRDAVSRKLMIKVWPNMAASQIAMNYKLHGPCFTLSNACASSLDAVGLGARLIASGMVDAAIVGGTEGGLSTGSDDKDFVPASAFARYAYGMGDNTEEDPRKACMPFDVDRQGMVFGEGAGVFILESAERARARQANVLAWVQGWGSAADAYHPSAPDPSGEWECLVMEQAINEASVAPGEIDALAAHGTGTPKGDVSEIRAISACYGDHAKDVSVMSIKGLLGHPTGAAGALSLAVALEGMKHNKVIHTGGLVRPEPDIEFDIVMDEPRRKPLEWVQANAFGFGGQNASLVVSAGPTA